jgi:alginate O-acetyltransferase complex protein AlgJ
VLALDAHRNRRRLRPVPLHNLIVIMLRRDPRLFAALSRLLSATPPVFVSVRPDGLLTSIKVLRVSALSARPLGLISRYRRYFAAIAFILLATPLLVGAFGPDETASILKEGRTPAPVLKVPLSWNDGTALPARVDAYLRDRFGLRRELIRLSSQIATLTMVNGNADVLTGRSGRMYAMQNEAVRQSAGLVMRDLRVTDTAGFLAAKKDFLARRGIRFLVASPPNTATIDPEDLPSWARNDGKATEYDLFLEQLSKQGVHVVDLRIPLRAARSEGKVYLRYDSHWTARGALVAFNAIVNAAGHPDWRMDAAAVLGAPTLRKGGDLARMMGVQDDVTETAEELILPGGSGDKWTSAPYSTFVKTGDKPTGTVMIVGDSFTASLFPPLLLAHVRQVVWAHHSLCGFDWQSIDRFHPDEVWWMPTERFLSCMPSELPSNSAG